MQTIRIFISSPGDVQEERDLARKVVEQLRRRYVGQLDLKAVLWEDLPLAADMSFQQGIDYVLSEHGVDIAVFILWSRLGSPTGPLIRRSDGSAYRSGTEREFDLMLEARRQSEGRRPHLLVYTRNDEPSFEERLRGRPTSDKADLLQQKKLVEEFIREEFHDEHSSTNLRAYHTFDRPLTFAQRLRVHLAGLIDGLAGLDRPRACWNVEEQGSPFRGLEAYTFEHAPIFFGREDEIVEIRARLREQACQGCAFLLILGASGAGKSSLARAGILPAIVDNEVDDTVERWRHAEFSPGSLRGEVLKGLARVLAEALPEILVDDESVGELAEGLTRDADLTFRLRIKPAFSQAGGGRAGVVRLVLLVDQLEELFTDTRISDDDRVGFIKAMEVLARSGSVWVVATMRSDFGYRFQSLPDLVRLREGARTFELLPPQWDAIGRLVREPARLAGLTFETRDGRKLDDQLVSDAAMHRELLPLLSHVLSQLVELRSSEGQLKFAAFETLGGFAGALSRHADRVYARLDVESQEALPELLMRLVTIGGDDQATFVRQHSQLSDLTARLPLRALVEALIEGRLLTASRHGDQVGATVTLAHEVLLRVWEPARRWAVENLEFLQLRSRLAPAQARWEQSALTDPSMREPSLLLAAGLPLEEGRALLERAPYLLSPATRNYVEQSLEHSQRQLQRQLRRRRIVMTSLALLAAVAVAGGGIAGWQATEANSQRAAAVAQRRVAELNATEAQHQRELAQREALVAEESRGEAERQERAALRSLEQSRRSLYSAQLVLAREQAHSDPAASIATLENPVRCPESVREFAWRYLYRLARRDRYTWQAHEQRVTFGGFARAGTLLITASFDGTVKVWSVQSGELLRTLRQGGLSVTAGAVSPDGLRIAIGDKGGHVELWSLDDSAESQELMGLDGPVYSLAWSSDQPIIAGCDSTSIHLWDCSTGNSISAMSVEPESVWSLAFSDDGKKLAAAGRSPNGTQGGSLRVFSGADAKTVLQSPPSDTGGFGALCFIPQSHTLVGVSSRSHYSKIDLNDFRSDFFFFPAGETGLAVAVSADGRRVAASTALGLLASDKAPPRLIPLGSEPGKNADQSISGRIMSWQQSANYSQYRSLRLWNVESAEPEAYLDGLDSPTVSLAFSPAGNLLATCQDDGSVTLWDVAQEPQRVTVTAESPVRRVAMSAQGQSLLVVRENGRASVWNLNSAREAVTLPENDLRYSTNGERFVEVLHRDGEPSLLRLWDFTTLQPIRVLEKSDDCQPAWFSPDGKTLAGRHGNEDAPKGISIWDAQKGNWRCRLEASAGVVDIGIDLSGNLAIGQSTDEGQPGKACVWDLCTGVVKSTLEQVESHSLYQASFSRDGRLIAAAQVADELDTVHVWSSESGRRIWSFQCPQSSKRLVFNAEGTEVVAVCHSHQSDGNGKLVITTWDCKTGEVISTFEDGIPSILPVALSPDHSLIAIGGGDDGIEIDQGSGRVVLWDLATHAPRAVLGGHRSTVWSLAFSPDSRTLATGSFDYRVKLWETSTGAELLTLPGHESTVLSLAFAGDGESLVSGSYDGTARVWAAPAVDESLKPWAMVASSEAVPARPNEPAWVRQFATFSSFLEQLNRVQLLANDHPEKEIHRRTLGEGYFVLGSEQRRLGQLISSRSSFEKSVEWYRPLAEAHPDDMQLRAAAGRSFSELGEVCRALADSVAALTNAQIGLQMRREILASSEGADEPVINTMHSELGASLNNVGLSLQAAGQSEQARDHFREAIEHQRIAFLAAPAVDPHRRFLLIHLFCLAGAERSLGHPREAVAAIEEARVLSGGQSLSGKLAIEYAQCASTAMAQNGESGEYTQLTEQSVATAVQLAWEAILSGSMRAHEIDEQPVWKELAQHSRVAHLLKSLSLSESKDSASPADQNTFSSSHSSLAVQAAGRLALTTAEEPDEVAALRLLITIGWSVNPTIEQAVIQSMSSDNEAVRYEAVSQIRDWIGKDEYHATSPGLLRVLHKLSDGQDENGQFAEASDRVRAAATAASQATTRVKDVENSDP